MGEILTIIIRLIFPLSILRYPLFGGLLALSIDYFDFDLVRILDDGNLTNYQVIDKTLDMYYLLLEVCVVAFWKNNLARLAAFLLFFYRLGGFLIFFITQNQAFLVIFFKHV